MKFFIDTANVEDIRKANDMGVICGVTTNPSLIAKEGRDFKEVIKEITSIVDGPISGFNPKFFIDALRVIDEEEVTLYMVNPKAPCFIKDDEGTFIYLILPVNFNAAAN